MDSVLDLLLNNPLIIGFLIGLLMICDYNLTCYGFRLAQQGFYLKITPEIYELNPSFQKIIHRSRRVNT